MRADLVGAPGDQLDLQFRQPPADRQRFVPGNNLLRAARRAVGNIDDAALGVLQKVIPQQRRRGIGAPKGDAQVVLGNAACLDLRGQKGLCRVIFGKQDQPAGAGVQPVAQNRTLALARRFQFFLHALKQRVVVGAVHRNARRLGGDDDVLVLIHKDRRGQPALLFQLVIGQKQLDDIAVLHPRGKRLLFAVELDFVFAQGFVQPPRPQGRVEVHQIFVHPHGQKAFYTQFFHHSTLIRLIFCVYFTTNRAVSQRVCH